MKRLTPQNFKAEHKNVDFSRLYIKFKDDLPSILGMLDAYGMDKDIDEAVDRYLSELNRELAFSPPTKKPAPKKTPKKPAPKKPPRSSAKKPAPKTKTKSRFSAPKNIDRSKIGVDPKRFQGREGEYSEETVKAIVAQGFDKNAGPMTVWYDSAKDKYFVLAGHSRWEASKRLLKAGDKDLETMNVKIFQGNEEEAIDYAVLESNRKSTQEGLKADLRAYKAAVKKGWNREKLLTLFRPESRLRKLQDLAFLNADGRFLEKLDSEQEKSYPYLARNAQWVGQMRGQVPQLTDSHEVELFQYLYQTDKKSLGIKKDKLFDLVNRKVGQLGFDASKPLNLKSIASVSPITSPINAEIKAIEKEMEDLVKKQEKARENIIEARKQGLHDLIENFAKVESDINKVLLRKQEERARLQKGLAQAERETVYDLFSTGSPAKEPEPKKESKSWFPKDIKARNFTFVSFNAYNDELLGNSPNHAGVTVLFGVTDATEAKRQVREIAESIMPGVKLELIVYPKTYVRNVAKLLDASKILPNNPKTAFKEVYAPYLASRKEPAPAKKPGKVDAELENAIKQIEKKVSESGIVANARDEEHLKRLYAERERQLKKAPTEYQDEDWLFIGKYPTGKSYSDKRKLDKNPEHQIAFVTDNASPDYPVLDSEITSTGTFQVNVYDDSKPEYKKLIADLLKKHPHKPSSRTPDEIQERYDQLEDENNHSEAAFLLTRYYGTPEDIMRMTVIRREHEKKGSITGRLQLERGAIAAKYLPMLKADFSSKAQKPGRKFTLADAERLGREAFEAGKTATPALDKKLNEAFKGDAFKEVGSAIPYLQAWSKGFHQANLKKPIPGMVSGAEMTKLKDLLKQYGWTATLEADTIKLSNKKGRMVMQIIKKGKRFQWGNVSDNTGEFHKVMTSGSLISGTQGILDEFFYEKKLDPVKAPAPKPAPEPKKPVFKLPKTRKRAEERAYERLARLIPPGELKESNVGQYYEKIENKGYMPLSLEIVGAGHKHTNYGPEDGVIVSIAHTYTEGGDLIFDPMMEVMVVPQYKIAFPVGIEHGALRKPMLYVWSDSNGYKNQREYKDQLSFLNTWLVTLEKQGFFKGKPKAPVEAKKPEPAKQPGTCPPKDANGKLRIDGEGLKELDTCIKALPDTKKANTDASGNYTPERKKLHDKIVGKFKENKPCQKYREPVAILTGGPPGSGKSYWLKNNAPWIMSGKLHHIDADEVRAKLPEYDGWNADITQPETSDIVNRMLKEIGEPCEYDLVYDGTMNKAKKYMPLVDQLKKLGYKVYVIYLTVPHEVSMKRAMDRYQRTGRYVPKFVIDEVFDRGLEAFEKVAKAADGYMKVDGITGKILEQGGMTLPEDRKYVFGKGQGIPPGFTKSKFQNGDKVNVKANSGIKAQEATYLEQSSDGVAALVQLSKEDTKVWVLMKNISHVASPAPKKKPAAKKKVATKPPYYSFKPGDRVRRKTSLIEGTLRKMVAGNGNAVESWSVKWDNTDQVTYVYADDIVLAGGVKPAAKKPTHTKFKPGDRVRRKMSLREGTLRLLMVDITGAKSEIDRWSIKYDNEDEVTHVFADEIELIPAKKPAAKKPAPGKKKAKKAAKSLINKQAFPEEITRITEEIAADGKDQWTEAQVIAKGKEINANRSFRAIAMDNNKDNKKRIAPTKENLLVWASKPGVYDLIGVDSFKEKEPTMKTRAQIAAEKVFGVFGL